METQNLEWLIFNALHGDVNGDIPEDLQVMIKAEQELHALLARHSALVKAVKEEIAARDHDYFWRCNDATTEDELCENYAELEAARAEVDRLLQEEK